MPRIFFQLTLFLLPFVLFGLYRLAIVEAVQEGRKPWPIRVLFGTGLGLFLISWIVLLFLDRGGREECYRPSQIIDGVLVEGEKYACKKDLQNVGVPRSEDPGGRAEGVGAQGADRDPVTSDDTSGETLATPQR